MIRISNIIDGASSTLHTMKDSAQGLRKMSRNNLPLLFAMVAFISSLGTLFYILALSGPRMEEEYGPAQRSVLQYQTDEQPSYTLQNPVIENSVDAREIANLRKQEFLKSEVGRRLQGIFIRLQRERENITQIVKTMGLDKYILSRAIPNWGDVNRLKTALKSVIETGRALNIGIMGGSVSTVNLYPRVLEESLKRMLGGDVKVNNAAIGATDSQYFAYCMKNHLDVYHLDIIMWEFAVNDYLKGVGASAQEEITREVLELSNQPQMMYINFLYGKQISERSCNNSEDVGGRELSEYYNIPSISLKEAVCKKVKAGKAGDLVGGENKNHLTTKAHLEMELFLRHFMLHVILNTTYEMLEQKLNPYSHTSFDVTRENATAPLPSPYFMTTRITRPRCWSSLLPQLGLSEYLWPIRAADGWNKVATALDKSDHKQLWVGNLNGSVIRFPIEIAPYKNLTSKVAISSFTCNECGAVRVIVDNDFARAATVYGRSKYRITWPTIVATDIQPGHHNITIKCLSNDRFQLAAIMTAYDIMVPIQYF